MTWNYLPSLKYWCGSFGKYIGKLIFINWSIKGMHIFGWNLVQVIFLTCYNTDTWGFLRATFDLFGIAHIRACDSSVLAQTSLVLPYNWITTRAGADNKHPMEDDPKIWKVEYRRHEKSYKKFREPNLGNLKHPHILCKSI